MSSLCSGQVRDAAHTSHPSSAPGSNEKARSSSPREVHFRVRADTTLGETVFVCGSSAQLGQWHPERALQLQLENSDANIWGVRVALPSQKINFRYIIGVLVDTDKVVVRRWETAIVPRSFSPEDIPADKAAEVHIFGKYNGEERTEPGWLTSETVVQLKFYNNPIVIWKKKYRPRQLLYRITPFDIAEPSPCGSPSNTEEGILPASSSDVEGSRWPIAEIAVIKEREHEFRIQDQFGHVYVPSEFAVVQTHVFRTDDTGYTVDYYGQTEAKESRPEHVGYSYILPGNLKDTSGAFTVPITGKKNKPIGQMTVSYLIVRPLSDHTCTCEQTYAKFWKSTRTLDVGHRGAGNARRTDRVENVLENTIASFNYVAMRGADMVELDVQLSKDMVPVIYHDYHICIHMKRKSLHEEEKFQVAVKDLTVAQLQQLKLAPTGERSYDFPSDDSEENQPFPTLQRVLESVDPLVGVNVEVKCPMQFRDGSWEMDSNFDLNRYLDIVLKTLLQHAGDRYIILSCFHPDICTMIRLKQNKYPLLFLTQGVTEKYPPYMDSRTSTVPMATYFALSINILGVNVHTEELLRDVSLIQFVKMRKLVLFCWGEDNNRKETIKKLKRMGVDGVIYDKLDLSVATPREKENVYVVDTNAPEFDSILSVGVQTPAERPFCALQ